jgi:hypothetical protein
MKNNTSKHTHPTSTLTKSSIIHLPVAHHNQHHYIDIIPEGRRRKCTVCADRNNTFRKSRISTWCSTCGVGLCVGDCFRKLHGIRYIKKMHNIHVTYSFFIKCLVDSFLMSLVLQKWFDFDFWCFNATFNNISAISWWPVLVVEEAGVPGENHWSWASN